MSGWLLFTLLAAAHVSGGISYACTVGRMAVLPGTLIACGFYIPIVATAWMFGQ